MTTPSSPKLLHKRYRIEGQLGSGTFGLVFQAYDTCLNVPVALKVLSPDEALFQAQDGRLDRDDLVRLFQREARFLLQLKHPGIPGYRDFFQERGRWMLAMELVQGGHICLKQPLTPRQVVWVGKQVGAILRYLHLQTPAIIHRDLKPMNLLVQQARLYLLDFGLACYPGIDAYHGGSEDYAAPEQRIGGTLTPCADIYALGKVLLTLLVGCSPNASVPDSPPLLFSYDSAAPQRLWDLLKRMTAFEPTDRPDALAVLRELDCIHQFLVNPGA